VLEPVVSSGAGCAFFRFAAGWFYIIEWNMPAVDDGEEEYGGSNWSSFGPFPSFAAAHADLDASHFRPGGFTCPSGREDAVPVPVTADLAWIVRDAQPSALLRRG
jgi:hypothetical protein